ncbi:MAG: exodeoxyribonuclease VII small subunit [Clostridiales bacterium]|nr:exodeoxyribonuclease VII small subunit [Clostridiales bacterium]
MKKAQEELRFEEKLALLENLTEQMEEGKLGLEELLKLYEQGILLSSSLKMDLDKAQATLMELKDGKLNLVEDA